MSPSARRVPPDTIPPPLAFAGAADAAPKIGPAGIGGDASNYIPPGGIRMAGEHEHHRQPMIARLARVEGHVAAIREMLAADRSCNDILIQLAAVKSALNQVARLVFEDHLDSCVRAAADAGDIQPQLEEMKVSLARYFAI